MRNLLLVGKEQGKQQQQQQKQQQKKNWKKPKLSAKIDGIVLWCSHGSDVTGEWRWEKHGESEERRYFQWEKSGIVSREVIEILLKEVIMSFFSIVRQF